MDRRLIVTVPFVVHLLGGGMFALSQSMATVSFTESQVEFLVLVGYLAPLVGMALIWLKNYDYGAPLLAGSAAATCWFVVYFFLLHDNPANVASVTGSGSGSYTASVIGVVVGSLATAGAGFWLWYRENDWFRSTVDGVLRPSESE
ncbi:hypothetical protein [Natronosalvus vescus]|uniref:hypothetical protein n=1 Tax=Natronosalvus vescus TaxID=2953881 RepID=UPI002090A514|nr:hypothetical protein [Natronosalvus vescus]